MERCQPTIYQAHRVSTSPFNSRNVSLLSKSTLFSTEEIEWCWFGLETQMPFENEIVSSCIDGVQIIPANNCSSFIASDIIRKCWNHDKSVKPDPFRWPCNLYVTPDTVSVTMAKNCRTQKIQSFVRFDSNQF